VAEEKGNIAYGFSKVDKVDRALRSFSAQMLALSVAGTTCTSQHTGHPVTVRRSSNGAASASYALLVSVFVVLISCVLCTQTLDDDVTFYNVAMWESKEAAFDFLKSKAAKCFLKYTLENNVYVTTTLLYPIEGSD
jgi:hypothetical protein